jgi:hypothetical protein
MAGVDRKVTDQDQCVRVSIPKNERRRGFYNQPDLLLTIRQPRGEVMSRKVLLIIGLVLLSVIGWRALAGQTPELPTLDPQEGIFVTPVAGQPLSATVTIEVKRELKDGTIWQRTATSLIARDSQGHIHNEAHAFVPLGRDRESVLMSVLIYDPQTRLNIFLNPHTHIARQLTLSREPSTVPPANWAQMDQRFRPSTNVQLEDLGTQTMEGFYVHGYRRRNTYDA